MAKLRTHNEWFRPVSLGGRKSCPHCGAKLGEGSVWSWGEYVRAKWRTVSHFCEACWPEFRDRLSDHKGDCGCTFQLIGYHCNLPAWLCLEQPTCEKELVT